MAWYTNVLIVLVFLCCSQVAPADTPSASLLKIGAIYNLNGSQAGLDIPSSNGVLTAERMINEQGGVDGLLIDVILRDGQSDPAIIENAARDLIINESVPVVIGLSDTDMVLPAAKIAAEHQIPFITSGASSPQLPDEVPGFLYLACFGDNAQAALAAEYAHRNLSASTATVVYDDSMEYTRLLAKYFTERFTELGGEVLSETPLVSMDTLEDELANLTAAQTSDLYYIAVGPDDAPRAVRALQAEGMTVPIMGGDSYDTTELVDAAVSTREDVYYTTHAWFGGENQSPEVQEFVAAYKADHGTEPTPFSGLGYDTVMIAARAASNGITGEEIQKGIGMIKEYHGVTGILSYENGTFIPTKSVSLMAAIGDTLTQAENRIPEKVPEP